MIRNPSIALVCLLSLAAAVAAQEKPPASPAPPAPSPSPGGDTPTFPAQVDLVNVDVVVTDRKNVPVSGLTQADFVLLEDGNPQSISSFEAVVAPATASAVPPPKPRVSRNTTPEVRAGTGRTFMVVFDDIHLSPQQAHRAKSAVAEFLRSGVREGDRVSLVATGGGAWWSTRMEAGRDELIAMLKRLDGRRIPDTSPDRMSDYEAMRIHVFHDTQVEERVARRFETYGVSQRMAQSQESSIAGTGDPFVRGRATEIYFQSVARNRITLQVLQRVLLSLASTKGRKSLVLVSEGFIYDPNLDEFKQVIQASRRANVAIYFLDTRGLEGTSTYFTAEFGPALDTRDIGAAFAENLEASEGSESLAADSGGFSVKNTNDLANGVKRIAEESRSYYLLGYHPSNTAADGRFRKIEVKLARKGLKVRARKGYYASLPGGKSAIDKKVAGGDPDIQAALDSPYEEAAIPLRMTSYVYDETLLGKARVVVAAEVDMRDFAFEEKEGRFLGTLETLMIVAHRDSGEYFRPPDQKVDMKLMPATKERLLTTGYPVSHEFDLAPGGYQAKVVVRDKNRGAIGTVIHEFEVPELGALRVSTPLITDTLHQERPAAGAAPASPPPPAAARPALVVRREFPAEGMLYCQYEVYGAQTDKKSGMPKVSAGYQIRRTDGTVVTEVPPSLITPTSIGKLSRMVGTGLPGATPGEYELVLSVKDELAGKTVEVREPFTLVEPRKPAADASAGSAPR